SGRALRREHSRHCSHVDDCRYFRGVDRAALLQAADASPKGLRHSLRNERQARKAAPRRIQGGGAEQVTRGPLELGATEVGSVARSTARKVLPPVASPDLGIYPEIQSQGFWMAAPLDPVIAQIIPLLPLRDPTVMTPQNAREALRALAASRAAIPPPAVASVNDVSVKGADGARPARVYRVASASSPTVVFFHGGGWVAGDLETHDRQARWLAIETGAVVVSVDYRCPPEIRFPGAFEDAFAAVADVAARISEFGGDASRLGVAGASAGGNLAATTAIACRDAGIRLAAQLLVYPVTDVVGNYADKDENARFPSRAENADGYFLSRAVMEWFC